MMHAQGIPLSESGIVAREAIKGRLSDRVNDRRCGDAAVAGDEWKQALLGIQELGCHSDIHPGLGWVSDCEPESLVYVVVPGVLVAEVKEANVGRVQFILAPRSPLVVRWCPLLPPT